jgi:CspA family cold shock protein
MIVVPKPRLLGGFTGGPPFSRQSRRSAPSSVLVCDIAAGPRGPQVTAIHSVEAGSGPPPGEHRSRPSFGGAPQGETIEGRVKFFNVEKGFGFIAPDGGGQDVFVSARTLTKSGLTTLESDQRVRATTRMGQKGPMADQVDLL